MTEQQEGMDQMQDAPRLDVGKVLREARERMGMSLEEVAGRLKFAPRQITALEEGDFGQLPEMTFVRGFVRSYARLLQVDEAPLLAALPGGVPARQAAPESRPRENFLPRVSGERNQNVVWIAGALVIALVIGMLMWGRDSGQSAQKPAPETKTSVETTVAAESKPDAEAKPGEGAKPGEAKPEEAKAGGEAKPMAEAKPRVAAKPSVAAKASVEAKPGAETPNVPAAAPTSGVAVADAAAQKPARARTKGLVRLDFDEDSWVEVKDGGGKIVLSTLGIQGSGQNVGGTPPFSVTIGNAKGVRLYYKGQPIDLGPYTNVDVAHVTLE